MNTDERHPYSGISIDEWSAANARVMNKLLMSGELPRTDIEYYLAYTAIIMDMVSLYEWNSILDFDWHYREQQAAHGFMWGYINPVMELQLLTPRNRNTNKHQYNQRRSNNKHYGQEECKQWKATNGHCHFGDRCRFKHVPLQSYQNSVPVPSTQTYMSKNGSTQGTNPLS